VCGGRQSVNQLLFDTMSGRRWGDSSDEEDGGGNQVAIARVKVQASSTDEPHHQQITEEADFAPNTDQEYVDYEDNPQTEVPADQVTDEDDEQEEEQEEEPESEEEDEETRQRRIDAAKEAAAKKKAEQEAKKKAATVEDQLDNLDDILNEFGIETQAPKKEADAAKNGNGALDGPAADSNEANGPASSGTLSKRKKPKKKKSENGHVESVSESQEPADVTAPLALDPDAAAKVLKAKVAAVSKGNTKKPMSTAQSAAAAAAKEMKTSAADEKKKKKKSKQQAQNFGR
jgi:hypothetical protein